MDPEGEAKRMIAVGFDMIASDPQLARVYLSRGVDLLRQAIRRTFTLFLLKMLPELFE